MKLPIASRRFQNLLASIIVIVVCCLTSRGADVSLYAVFKGEKYNQVSTGLPVLGSGNPYRFGAIAAPSIADSIVSATVSVASGAAQPLSFDVANDWFSYSAKFSTQAALDTAAPTGTFTLVVNTLNQGQKSLTLNLPSETFPAAPHISNLTAGQTINPTADFTLRWDPFPGGTTNDFILVLMGDQNTGVSNFRSPSPYQVGALTGTATSVLIPASELLPNTVYVVELTFFKMKSVDTTSYPGAAGLVGFDSFTDSTLMTTSSPVQFALAFRQFAQGGSFLNSSQATPEFPVSINAYRAELIVNGTTNFASPTQVFFTGPEGSGLTNTSSGPTGFAMSVTDGLYFSPKVSQPAAAPTGAWSVAYQGTVHNFSAPDPQVASHLVIPVPKVGLANGLATNVSWSYYDPSGNALPGVPAVLSWIQLQAFDSAGSFIYNSEVLAPSALNYVFTNSLAWTNVDMLRFLYQDTLNNSYLVAFPNVSVTTPVRLEAVNYSANGFIVQVTGQAGHGYRVQFSTDLAHWADLVTTNLATSTLQLLDAQAASSPKRFYRAVLAN